MRGAQRVDELADLEHKLAVQVAAWERASWGAVEQQDRLTLVRLASYLSYRAPLLRAPAQLQKPALHAPPT